MLQASSLNPMRTDVPVGAPARFQVDGLDHAFTARVDQVDDGGMTLRQELPFLQLDTKLRDEHGREASLASVAVAVRDGTPSLLLELRYAKQRRDATVPYVFEDPHGDPESTEIVVAPAAPLPPLTHPRRPWHVMMWARLRSIFQ